MPGHTNLSGENEQQVLVIQAGMADRRGAARDGDINHSAAILNGPAERSVRLTEGWLALRGSVACELYCQDLFTAAGNDA